jgi:predicted cobalt transporter CbtA
MPSLTLESHNKRIDLSQKPAQVILEPLEQKMMDEKQRKFFTTNYAEIPQRRIWVYATIVICAFGTLGLMMNQMIFVVIGAGVAIGIPLFGRMLDYSKTNPPGLRAANKIYTVLAIIYAVLVLALIVVPGIIRMVKRI